MSTAEVTPTSPTVIADVAASLGPRDVRARGQRRPSAAALVALDFRTPCAHAAAAEARARRGRREEETIAGRDAIVDRLLALASGGRHHRPPR